MRRIVYLSPFPNSLVTGGIKVMFRHVEMLRAMGIDACVFSPQGLPIWMSSSAPLFEGKDLKKPATVTVFQNGVLVQDHVEVKGTTFNSGPPYYEKHNPKAPLMLQDHGNPVSYRNIWIREL